MPFTFRRVTLCFGLVGAIFLTLLPLAVDGAAIVTNGAFEDGLDGWEIRGAIAGSSGIAVVTDENASVSLLFQPVEATPGIFEVQFDFRNALSNNVPTGTLADTFFATLYFTDDVATLDIDGGVFDRAIRLFDLDSGGPFNVNGTIGPSSKGTDWSLFTLFFQNTNAFIVPAFELRDFNFINDDSAVAVDNVLLVPEPESWLLTSVTLVGLTATHRMRRGERRSLEQT
jgi:hypothetical protein